MIYVMVNYRRVFDAVHHRRLVVADDKATAYDYIERIFDRSGYTYSTLEMEKFEAQQYAYRNDAIIDLA